MVFPVVIYGCDSWTIKKAECQRIDAFELWYQRRLLRVPWTARRSNQSILKGISPKYSLEGLMLKLKLQYSGHPMRRADSLEKTLIWERLRAGREEGNRWWDSWMVSPTQWTWVWIDSGSWWWTGWPGMLQFMGSQRVGHDWATELIILLQIRLSKSSKSLTSVRMKIPSPVTCHLGCFLTNISITSTWLCYCTSMFLGPVTHKDFQFSVFKNILFSKRKTTKFFLVLIFLDSTSLSKSSLGFLKMAAPLQTT